MKVIFLNIFLFILFYGSIYLFFFRLDWIFGILCVGFLVFVLSRVMFFIFSLCVVFGCIFYWSEEDFVVLKLVKEI